MENVKGNIESVEQKSGIREDGSKWRRASLKISGKSYSTFDEKIIDEFRAGDLIEIEYEDSPDGRFHNIKSIKKIDISDFQPASDAPEKPIKIEKPSEDVWIEKDKRISRLACLNTSVKMLEVLNETDPEKAKEAIKETKLIDLVMNLAEVLEQFVWR